MIRSCSLQCMGGACGHRGQAASEGEAVHPGRGWRGHPPHTPRARPRVEGRKAVCLPAALCVWCVVGGSSSHRLELHE